MNHHLLSIYFFHVLSITILQVKCIFGFIIPSISCIKKHPSTPIPLRLRQCTEIAPELQPQDISHASTIISSVLGQPNTPQFHSRRSTARIIASAVAADDQQRRHHLRPEQLVYGELGISTLSTILDAVGVRKGDIFLDIGSGDGELVLAAAMLYPNHIERSVGVEIVEDLWKRSNLFLERILERCGDDDDDVSKQKWGCKIEFVHGDIHDVTINNDDVKIRRILESTTLAVCFATTWSLGGDRRMLPDLSRALRWLPVGARVVVVDGRLMEEDGFFWEGDLKVECADTAPYSTASLFCRI